MNVASKLQLKRGSSIALINQPSNFQLDLGAGSPIVGDPTMADAVIVFCASTDEFDRLSDDLV